MPFAQNPSIFPASSAFAAVTPIHPGADRAGHGSNPHLIFFQIDPRLHQQPAKTHFDPRGGADESSFDNADVAARWPQVGPHDQEPVHALRLGTEQPDAFPFRECSERRMRRSADKVHGAIAQRLVTLVHREDQLERNIEPFAREEAKFDRGRGGEI